MTADGRRRLKRFLIAGSVTVVATAGAGTMIHPAAGAVVAAIGFLGTAIAADDKLGTCFPLAVLFLIIVVLVLMALYAAVMVGGR